MFAATHTHQNSRGHNSHVRKHIYENSPVHARMHTHTCSRCACARMRAHACTHPRAHARATTNASTHAHTQTLLYMRVQTRVATVTNAHTSTQPYTLTCTCKHIRFSNQLHRLTAARVLARAIVSTCNTMYLHDTNGITTVIPSRCNIG